MHMSKHSAHHEYIGHAAAVHDTMHDLLPAYATALALGQTARTQYANVAAHLEYCAECRETLTDLLDLTCAAYSDTVSPALNYPKPNLSFLQSRAPDSHTPQRWWTRDALGQVVITFSDAFLASLQQPLLAGAARGQPVYTYRQRSGDIPDLHLSVDVYTQEPQRDRCCIQIGVELLTREPLDQAATVVRLRADDVIWEGETDEVGCITFQDVPLVVLPRLTIEIAPQHVRKE
jgi:hypothetical protein